MKSALTTAAALIALALPSHAEGDAESGEETFKKCKACHIIASEDETFVKGGKVGPNLYGVVGRTAGTVEGYKYGKSLAEAGEAGLVWDEPLLAAYVKDPKAFLQETLDDKAAKSKMAYKLKKGAEDVAAYLATFGASDAENAGDSAASSDG